MQSKSLSARYKKLRVLHRIANLITSTTNSATLLRRILGESVQALRAQGAMIALAKPEEQLLEIAAIHGQEAPSPAWPQILYGQGVIGRVASSAKAARAENVHYLPYETEQSAPQTHSVLAVPLRAEGGLIGVLSVDTKSPATFSEEDEKLLVALARQAARLIQTSRVYERLEQQARQLEALFEVGQALISPDPLPDILNRITQTVRRLMEIKQCSVMLLNDKRELVLSAISGESQHYTQRPFSSISNSLLGEVVSQREPTQVFEVKRVSTGRPSRNPAKDKVSSLLSVPIFFHDALIGILNIYMARPRRFSDEEMRLLNAFASLCGIAIANAQHYEKVLSAEQSIRHTDRLATLGILSAEIAHEIRNPVTIISMLLHSLVEDNAITPGHEKDISIIIDKLERINRIVSQVLHFSKQREMTLEWVNINTILDELLILINHNISAQQLLLKRQFEPSLPLVLADRGHLDQVFLNLLLNALQAMPNGGALTVRTACTEALEEGGQQGVTVTIRDTGVGISPELLPQLFSPFVSTRKEGIGLGLFVSQKLLSQYGGKISVKSVPEKGTTFVVEIPIEARSE